MLNNDKCNFSLKGLPKEAFLSIKCEDGKFYYENKEVI